MASFEEAISAYFTTRTQLVTALPGGFYDEVLPQDGAVGTAGTFQVLDNRSEPHFTGEAREHPVFVQVDTFGHTAEARRTAAQVVREQMRVWKGSWGGVVIRRAFKEFDSNTTVDAADAGPLPRFRNIQRWKVLVREPNEVTV